MASLRQKRTLHAGINVGAKVTASAGVYNNVQRPVPVVASPYIRNYPVVAPYPVARSVVVSVPQTVAVPITRPYATVPVVAAGQTVAGVVPGYYYPYTGYNSYGGFALRL